MEENGTKTDEAGRGWTSKCVFTLRYIKNSYVSFSSRIHTHTSIYIILYTLYHVVILYSMSYSILFYSISYSVITHNILYFIILHHVVIHLDCASAPIYTYIVYHSSLIFVSNLSIKTLILRH